MGTEPLVSKYNALIALRREREALEAAGVLHLDGDAGRDRKARCRRLAAEFPGSLRELEALSAEQLEERRAAVQSSSYLAAFIARYHELGRSMAALKRWQGAFRRRHRRRPNPGEARAAMELSFLSDDELTRWLTPPEGRVHERVWERLAAERGESVQACKARFLGFDPGDG